MPKKIYEGPELAEKLNKVCLVGEGRGRMRLQREKYLFGYESAFKTDSLWSMAVDMSLYGQELLNIHYPKGFESEEFQVGGSFWPRLKRESANQEELRSIKLFLRSIAKFVQISKLAQMHRFQCNGTTCQAGAFEVKAKGGGEGLILELPLTEQKVIRAQVFDEAETFFKRISVTIYELEGDREHPWPYVIELFHKDCY